jgi:hypothetical protein
LSCGDLILLTMTTPDQIHLSLAKPGSHIGREPLGIHISSNMPAKRDYR